MQVGPFAPREVAFLSASPSQESFVRTAGAELLPRVD